MKKNIVLMLIGVSCLWYWFPGYLRANESRELWFHFLFFLMAGFWIKNIWIRIFYLVVTFLTFYILTLPMIQMANKLLAYYNFAIAVLGYQLLVSYFDKEDIHKILNLICILVLVNVVMAYAQFFGFRGFYSPRLGIATGEGVVVHGFMHNPNHFAALVGIGLPCFFRHTQYTNKWLNRVTRWWLFIPFLVIPLFFKNNTISHTRGGLLLLAFVLLYFGYFFFRNKMKKTWLLAACFITFVSIGFLIYNYVGTSKDGDRFKIWKSAIQALDKRTAIQGCGIGTFKVIRPCENKETVEAHNEYVQIVFELGIISLLPILGFLVQAISRFLRWKDTYDGRIIFCGLCCVAINCVTNFTFHQVALMIVGILYFVVWELLSKREKGEKGGKGGGKGDSALYLVPNYSNYCVFLRKLA